MKKLLALLLALLVTSPALSESITLESMSTEDLLALKAEINSILMKRIDVWSATKVPAGVWLVGVEIPAGHWTIRFDDPDCGYVTDIKVGENKSKYADRLVGDYTLTVLSNASKTSFTTSVCEIDIVLKDGQYVEITKDFVYFSPYGAYRDLGF